MKRLRIPDNIYSDEELLFGLRQVIVEFGLNGYDEYELAFRYERLEKEAIRRGLDITFNGV